MPSRRDFLGTVGIGSMGFAAMGRPARGQQPPGADILGAEGVKTTAKTDKVWRPISDRKIRVGIIGYGVCKFGARRSGSRTIPTSPSRPSATCSRTASLELARSCRVRRRIRRWRSWSRTTPSRPCSSRPTPPATRSTP